MQVRKQQFKLDMEQQTSSKQEKEYVKDVYCHPVYLTSKQSKSCEMPGCMKIAGINEAMKQRRLLESRLLGEISITLDTQMTSPLWQKVKN